MGGPSQAVRLRRPGGRSVSGGRGEVCLRRSVSGGPSQAVRFRRPSQAVRLRRPGGRSVSGGHVSGGREGGPSQAVRLRRPGGRSVSGGRAGGPSQAAGGAVRLRRWDEPVISVRRRYADRSACAAPPPCRAHQGRVDRHAGHLDDLPPAQEALLRPQQHLGEAPHESDAEAHAGAEDKDGDTEAVHEAVVLHGGDVECRVPEVHLDGQVVLVRVGRQRDRRRRGEEEEEEDDEEPRPPTVGTRDGRRRL